MLMLLILQLVTTAYFPEAIDSLWASTVCARARARRRGNQPRSGRRAGRMTDFALIQRSSLKE